jgi:hypothetical protein
LSIMQFGFGVVSIERSFMRISPQIPRFTWGCSFLGEDTPCEQLLETTDQAVDRETESRH